MDNIPLNTNIIIDVKIYEVEQTNPQNQENPEYIYNLIYEGQDETNLKQENDNVITINMNTTPLDYANWGWRVSGPKYTYTVEKAPVNEKGQYLFMTYSRSKQAASDEIEFSDVDIEVTWTPKNSERTVTITYNPIIYFDLDYNGDYKFDNGEIVHCADTNGLKDYLYNNPDCIASYKTEIPLDINPNVGDTITVQLKNAVVTGHGIDNHMDLRNITFSVITSGADESNVWQWYSLFKGEWENIINRVHYQAWDSSIERDSAVVKTEKFEVPCIILEQCMNITRAPDANEKVVIELNYDRSGYGAKEKIKIENAIIRFKKNNEDWITKTNQTIDFTTNPWGARTENLSRGNDKLLPEWGHYLADYNNRSQYGASVDISELGTLNVNDIVTFEVLDGDVYFEDSPVKLVNFWDNGSRYSINFSACIQQKNKFAELSAYYPIINLLDKPLALYKCYYPIDEEGNESPMYWAFIRSIDNNGQPENKIMLIQKAEDYPKDPQHPRPYYDMFDKDKNIQGTFTGDPRRITNESNEVKIKLGDGEGDGTSVNITQNEDGTYALDADGPIITSVYIDQDS